jgi:hypothetical protein
MGVGMGVGEAIVHSTEIVLIVKQFFSYSVSHKIFLLKDSQS